MNNIFSGRVLVVEDNLINQIVLKAQLEILGFSVDLAENGRIALEKIEPDKYDIIFMDIQMPIMDGIECTHKIRTSHNARERIVPIIAVTANATRNYRHTCEQQGMNGFVSKPLKIEELIDQISNVMTAKTA